MTPEQWFGLMGLVVGLYLFVCSTWKRDFALYDWKARRAIAWYGEEKTHLGYQVGGVIVMIVGVLKLIGLF
jgi:hypothetical protein